MMAITEILAGIGVVLLLPKIYSLLYFLWLYIRPSSVAKYLHGPTPAWAIVTGASDGIGKAVAGQLHDKGFNLILHGRNEQKLRAVVEGLRARGAGREVRHFIANAASPNHDFAKLVEPFRGLNVTLLINNVGGGDTMKDERLDGFSEAEVMQAFYLNAYFPLFLTRALLPQLRTAAQHGPVLVHFVGSLASEIGPPRLVAYSAAKAFLKGLTRALDNDERAWTPSGVRFAYMYVGEVVTKSMKTGVTVWSPSVEAFAKSYADKIGCGRRGYYPWVFHAIHEYVTQTMGEGVVDRVNVSTYGDDPGCTSNSFVREDLARRAGRYVYVYTSTYACNAK